jgi:hypothetical protein
MARKKGRQSNGFPSKNLRAQHQYWNIQYEQQTTRERVRQEVATKVLSKPPERRPFRLQLSLVSKITKQVMDDNQSYQQYVIRERRRRHGYLPSSDGAATAEQTHRQQRNNQRHNHHHHRHHPPGFILNYGSNKEEEEEERRSATHKIPTLQSLSLKVFATYVQEYLDSISLEELHSIIALLPSETIEELSTLISTSQGFNDQIMTLLGCHSHINGICIRPTRRIGNYEDEEDGTTAPSRSTVTDKGIVALIPKGLAVKEKKRKGQGDNHITTDKSNSDPDQDDDDDDDDVLDCWEDYNDTSSGDECNNTNDLHSMLPLSSYPQYMMGCNIRLRRFELLDSPNVSSSILLRFLEKCSGVTHLSLSGSTFEDDDDDVDGRSIMNELPRALPQLQVLDLTRCVWVTTKSMIFNMIRQYSHSRKQQQQQQVREDGKATPAAIQHQLPPPEVFSDYGWFHHSQDSFYCDGDDDDW